MRLASATGLEGVAELLIRNWSLALGLGIAWFWAPASMVPAFLQLMGEHSRIKLSHMGQTF